MKNTIALAVLLLVLAACSSRTVTTDVIHCHGSECEETQE